MSGYGGGARWNDETQSWETGSAPVVPAPVVPGQVVPAPAASAPVVPEPAAPAPLAGGGGSGPVVPPPPPPPEYAPVYAPEYGPGGTPAHAPQYVPETGGWHYPVPGGAPAARPRARAAVVAGVAVAVLAAGSAGGWLVWGRDDGKDPAAGGPAASVSAPPEATDPSTDPSTDPGGDPTTDPATGTPSGSPSPSDTSTPTDDVPPPGYSAQQDLKGFTIAVPDGWDRTESDQGVFFNAPDGRSLVQVFVVAEAGLTPYEALRGASEDGRTNKPGYQEISLERVTGEPGAPADAAELVYAYDREGGRRKVVDRAFTAEDGNHYAILAAGPEADWPKQREVLRVALEFFRPGAH
ncbi:hypothetical protein ACFVZH_10565 [Streptomyces sp. NPDC059534]|uniref:hypothetical protein n=1 Tax=Streptomyces sp. NPDC059534 TaxID=3346859 RepID=UPI0036BA425E